MAIPLVSRAGLEAGPRGITWQPFSENHSASQVMEVALVLQTPEHGGVDIETARIASLPFSSASLFDVCTKDKKMAIIGLLREGKFAHFDLTHNQIYAAAKTGWIEINDQNVTDYVRFFFYYVTKPYHFIIVENAKDFEDKLMVNEIDILNNSSLPRIFRKDADGTWHIELLGLFRQSLVKVRVTVGRYGSPVLPVDVDPVINHI